MSKKQKSAIPKRIAGVKVPKVVRRGLKDLAASQNGKAVLTEALLAAGAVLAAHEAKPGSKTRKLADKHAPDLEALKAELTDARTHAFEKLESATRTFTQSLRGESAAPLARIAPETAPPAE